MHDNPNRATIVTRKVTHVVFVYDHAAQRSAEAFENSGAADQHVCDCRNNEFNTRGEVARKPIPVLLKPRCVVSSHPALGRRLIQRGSFQAEPGCIQSTYARIIVSSETDRTRSAFQFDIHHRLAMSRHPCTADALVLGTKAADALLPESTAYRLTSSEDYIKKGR